jgi:hypothetical protein
MSDRQQTRIFDLNPIHKGIFFSCGRKRINELELDSKFYYGPIKALQLSRGNPQGNCLNN